MSAGEVTVEDGDVFGTPVVEASRLCGAAAPGQVLATAAAAGLSRHGPATRRGGAAHVERVPEPVAAFEVEWTDAAAAAGPVGGLLPAPLRTEPTIPFVARPQEWDQLAPRVGGDAGRRPPGRARSAANPARARPGSPPSSRGTSPREGATVLFGACREGGGPPYGPVT